MTYYTGIDPPDDEPRRNKYSEKKSKFTEKVAAGVKDGDLYLSKRARGGDRFWVQVNPGEHDLPEDGDGGLICVTHVYRAFSWDTSKGKWEKYDGEGNIVIRVNRDMSDRRYAAMDAIQSALYHTPLGRAIGQDAIRKLADELAEQFGLQPYGRGDDAPTFTLSEDHELRLRKAVVDLLTWAPERGYDEEIGQIGARNDGVGYAKDADEYTNLVNGLTNGFGDEVTEARHRKPLPLLSEPVYYAVAGSKDAGRGFKARLRELMEAAGVEEEDVE